MKFRLLFLLIFIGFTSAGFAQKRYAEIKQTADYPVDGLTTNMVRLFEGEIYEIIFDDSDSNLRDGKKGLLLRFGAQSVEVPRNGTENYVYPVQFSADTFGTILAQKDKFIYRSPADENMYRLNMTGIAPGESIYISSQSVKDILRLETKREADFSAEYFSKHFSNKHLRIIIPGYPTLVYEGNKIGLPSAPDPTSDSDRPEGVLLDDETAPSGGSSVGTYLLVFLSLLAAGFIFWLNKDKFKLPERPVRNAPKKGFKKTVNPKPAASPDVRPEVRPEPRIVRQLSEEPEPEEETPAPAEDVRPENPTGPFFDQEQLLASEAEISRLSAENQELRRLLARAQERPEVPQNEAQIPAFISPESPEDFAECQIGFFELLDSIEAEAEDFYQRTDEVGSAERLVFESVMFRYYRSKSELKTLADWRSLLKELQKTGRISRPSIVRSVKQSGMSDEALFSALQDSVFEEVFKPLAGAALLMTEELRCIEKFTGMSFLLSVQISERFEELGEEICRYSEDVLDKKIHYLPLFAIPGPAVPVRTLASKSQLQKPGIYDKIVPEPGTVGYICGFGFEEEPTEIYLVP